MENITHIHQKPAELIEVPNDSWERWSSLMIKNQERLEKLFLSFQAEHGQDIQKLKNELQELDMKHMLLKTEFTNLKENLENREKVEEKSAYKNWQFYLILIGLALNILWELVGKYISITP